MSIVAGRTATPMAELPGIDPDGDVRQKNHREPHDGSSRRTVPLPPGPKVADLTASHDDSVLEVRVPLGGPEPPSAKIPVTRTG